MTGIRPAAGDVFGQTRTHSRMRACRRRGIRIGWRIQGEPPSVRCPRDNLCPSIFTRCGGSGPLRAVESRRINRTACLRSWRMRAVVGGDVAERKRMAIIYTENEIAQLIREPKEILGDWRTRQENRHIRGSLDVSGSSGSEFCIKLRQNLQNPLGFSVIWRYPCRHPTVSFMCFATMDGAIGTGTVLSETVSLPFTFIRRPQDIRPWAVTRMATQNLRNGMPRWPGRWPAWCRMRTSTRRSRSPSGWVKERS